ncbi:MAG: YheT family hydrolase [Alphaproteobacteria bacterium]
MRGGLPQGHLDREHRQDAPRVPPRIGPGGLTVGRDAESGPTAPGRAGSRPAEPFRRAWWLPGPHLQTVWGNVARPRDLVAFRREWLATPDGDEVALDHVDAPSGAPRLLVLHGLEGSSFSVYVQGLLARARAAGFAGTALNFRSCAREPERLDRWIPNRTQRLYHSGETGDLDFVANELARREPAAPLFAIGVSLGGNVLLKWLGEHPGQRTIAAAATISVPYDLARGARHLEHPVSRLYLRNFLPTLVAKTEGMLRRHPALAERVDLDRVRRSRTFHEFDGAATAPVHGFADAGDYYARSSSIGFVGRITTPTFCLSAIDDPFLPAEVAHAFREAAPPAVEVHLTETGGHVGFVAGPRPARAEAWAERRAIEWFVDRARDAGAVGESAATVVAARSEA